MENDDKIPGRGEKVGLRVETIFAEGMTREFGAGTAKHVIAFDAWHESGILGYYGSLICCR